MTRNPVKP